jgi:hypothetical protein
MTYSFKKLNNELDTLITLWEEKLIRLPEEVRAEKRNRQHRNIRQIVGHMVDSATNNTHRIIHMHYQSSPISYPDYANLGNNDRWIAIQNYQEEDWDLLVKLWASVNRHIVHLIEQVNMDKLGQLWVSALGEEVSLEEMIRDYPRHFKLHLDEITELL